MRCDDNIIDCLRKYVDSDKILDLLEENKLYHRFSRYFTKSSREEMTKSIALNHVMVRRLMDIAFHVYSWLEKNDVSYLAFKGFILSDLLYGDPYERMCGDIDIYVGHDHFEETVDHILECGFCQIEENAPQSQHHLIFALDSNGEKGIILELHSHILSPLIEINEGYLRENWRHYTVRGVTIATFDVTATFLHMIYHLYMDVYLASINLYRILIDREVQRPNQFMYRAYEIARYSELYWDEIKWKDIVGDFKNQNLKIIFKRMVIEISKIFPQAFPNEFVMIVCQLRYSEDEMDPLYKRLDDLDYNYDKDLFESILCSYIDESWGKRFDKNLCIKPGGAISLSKGDLCCRIQVEKRKNGLAIIFQVSDADFCISEIGDYDTTASDGIHMIICGTEKLSYHSIFFFPKEIDGEIQVIACDVLDDKNHMVDEECMIARFSKTMGGYSMEISVFDKFLLDNHLSHYFYLGAVVADCDSETRSRRDQIIFSDDVPFWYNPIYFAKVLLE